MIGGVDSAELVILENTRRQSSSSNDDDDPVPAEIQLVHGGVNLSGSGDVDVYLLESAECNALGGVTPFETLSYGDFSLMHEVDPSTDYRFCVTTAGDSADLLFDSGYFDLAEGARLIGALAEEFRPGADVIQMLRVTDQGASQFPNRPLVSDVRFLNLVPDGGNYDFYLGNSTAVPPTHADVAYGEFSDFEIFTGTRTNVLVTPTGVDNEFVHIQSAFQLPGGQKRTYYVSGLEADDSVGGASIAEQLRPIRTQSQLRFIHGAPGAGSVDLYLLMPEQTIEDIQPLIASAPLRNASVRVVAPRDYRLLVMPAGGDDEVDALVSLEPADYGGLEELSIYSFVFRRQPGGAEDDFELVIDQEL
jgi:hypothetical protein